MYRVATSGAWAPRRARAVQSDLTVIYTRLRLLAPTTLTYVELYSFPLLFVLMVFDWHQVNK